MIIKLSKFRLSDTTQEDDFMAAAKIAQWEFFELQPGYINRELFKDKKNEWIDIVRWKSIKDVKRANKTAQNVPAISNWFNMLDENSLKTWHLDLVDEYV